MVNALDDLPEEIGLLSARVLVPVMASVSSVGRFNLLDAEATAALPGGAGESRLSTPGS